MVVVNIINVDKQVEKSLDIDEMYLKNNYWNVVRNLKDNGFEDEKPFILRNSQTQSTEIIDKMIKIMKNEKCITSLVEDIKLFYMLKMYCNDDIYDKWISNKYLFVKEEEPSYFKSGDLYNWIQKNVDPIRWKEVGLDWSDSPSITDKYVLCNITIKVGGSKIKEVAMCNSRIFYRKINGEDNIDLYAEEFDLKTAKEKCNLVYRSYKDIKKKHKKSTPNNIIVTSVFKSEPEPVKEEGSIRPFNMDFDGDQCNMQILDRSGKPLSTRETKSFFSKMLSRKQKS